jgi:sensor domain CHASE-containing protein
MSQTRMKNQSKSNPNILVSIVPLSILFVLVQAASLVGFFHVSFRAVEEYAIRKNLQSCIDAMQKELNRIGGVVYEWSAWDAAASFIKGSNPNFIKDSMVESSMQEQNLNAFCILDSHGKPVWTRCVKVNDNKPVTVNLSLFSPEVLVKNTALWEHKDPNSRIAGYYSTEGGVLMLFSRPVTSSNNTGPVCGAVIMGRFVNDAFIESITQKKCQDFKWWNLRTEYTRNAMQHYLSRITAEIPVYIEADSETAAAYTILPDIDGKDAILIKFVTTNDVASFKQGWMAKCLGIYVIEGLIFIIYLAAFANKHCTKCRAQITQDDHFIAEPQCVSFEQMAETQRSTEELPI